MVLNGALEHEKLALTEILPGGRDAAQDASVSHETAASYESEDGELHGYMPAYILGSHFIDDDMDDDYDDDDDSEDEDDDYDDDEDDDDEDDDYDEDDDEDDGYDDDDDDYDDDDDNWGDED